MNFESMHISANFDYCQTPADVYGELMSLPHSYLYRDEDLEDIELDLPIESAMATVGIKRIGFTARPAVYHPHDRKFEMFALGDFILMES